MAPKSPRRSGNLPAELTSFVGRRREIAEIKRMLSTSRLVTLTGVGGAGKTRLSLRVAADLQRAFPDGVWFVELAALEDNALLTQTIANALGVQDRTTRWPAPALAEYLSTKQLLMVLDNCEHLRDACAVLIQTLLRSAPGVRILVTSRQTLGLTGEHIFQVPTMSVPDVNHMPPLEALSQYEAVSLFHDRAAAVQPGFALTDENREDVVRICRRLDGIPLAIELTAVRLRALSTADILRLLENRYRLLTMGSPGALPRHQTLRALIDWSNELCSAQERSLWAQLAVFSGGFDLPATEAIYRAGDGDENAVIDLLTALIDKSILIAEEYDNRVRYRMLETIRQYGLERLREDGLETALRQRHRAYFEDMTERTAQEWVGADQEQLLTRIVREHKNIRSALEFCITNSGESESGLRIAGALWFFWVASGLTNEGRRWLERALQRESEPSAARARALWVCGYLSILQEDTLATRPMITECQHIAEHLNDAVADAWSVQLSGMAAMSQGDLEQAQHLLQDGLRRHRACGNTTGILDTCFYLVAVTALRRDLHRAARLCEQALGLCDSHHERWLKSYLLWDLGLVAWQLGDSKRAAASGRDGLRLANVFTEQWVIAFCVELLAWTANTELKHQRSARLLGGADTIWRSIGAPLFGMRHLIRYHEQCSSQVQETLGDERFDDEFRNGSRMTTDQLIGYALDERTPQLKKTAAPKESGSLTPREKEVADLIAQGLSNKSIAAELVIARRTAEAHVEHILNKLGFSSRAQIAAWVGAHDSSPAQAGTR